MLAADPRIEEPDASCRQDASPEPVTVATALPGLGECWGGRYQIRDVTRDGLQGKSWRALRVDTVEDVTLRFVPGAKTDPRAEVWRRLLAIDHPHLLRAQATIDVPGGWVEVQAAPSGRPVGEWRDRATLDPAGIERVARPVADALAALQARGLGHFAVSPETIFVEDRHGVMNFVLGGTEAVTLLAQDGLIPIRVNPYYAPPEAAGLFKHSPGAGLAAWDWWSLGRVLQELSLGRHVLGQLLQREVSRPTPELYERAEALLLEREAGATRAGAIEAMPAGDKRVELLLRGLLTSASEARWGAEQVAAWLRRETPKEHYRLPRNERLFRWRAQAYTFSDAAELFRSAEHWVEGIEQVWEGEKAGTLAHFLADSPSHRTLLEKHQDILKLAALPIFRAVPPPVLREAIAAVALLELAGGGMIWRGRRLDAAGLRTLFEESAGDAVPAALLRALAAGPLAMQIERHDHEAATLLTEFGRVATEAEALVRENRWLAAKDAAGALRLLRTVLEPVPALRTLRQRLRERFACSTDAVMEKLFKAPSPSHTELVVLAWAEQDAVARGFLTHVQWAERELRRLQERAIKCTKVLCWMQLGRGLAAGPWVFARWRWLSPAWAVGAAAIMFVWPGPRWLAAAVMPVLLAAGARLVLSRALAKILPAWVAPSRPWSLRDGVRRCRSEAGNDGHTIPDLIRTLQEINADIAGLTVLEPKPALFPLPPRFASVWTVSIASLILFAGVVVAGVWHIRLHPPTWREFTLAWHPPKPVSTKAKGSLGPDGQPLSPAELAAGGLMGPDGQPVTTAPDAAAGEGLTAASDDEPEKPHGPTKITWPFKPGDRLLVQLVTDSVEANAEQFRYATERGREISDPYRPETINTLVILRVPTEKQVGLMIYDAQKRTLANMRVYLVNYAPYMRSWIEVAGRPGIYLGDL
jgi:hypothetical protein